MTNEWGPFSLSGKTAVVTGGAMGIGFGIAKRFLEAGANVLIADLEGTAAERAVERLRGGPGRIVAMPVDIGADAAPQAIVARAVEAFGGIDILVNNAGIFPLVPVLEMSPEVLDRVLRVNLRGLVLLSKAVGIQMVKQQRGGKIVNIGSIDSVHPSMVGLGAYDGSKGGVLMFTRSFALEMAPHHVQVNVILPGAIATEGTARPMGAGTSEAQQREMLASFVKAKVPLGRMGVPDDIATAAVFLASAASDYVTGTELVVDGGTLLT